MHRHAPVDLSNLALALRLTHCNPPSGFLFHSSILPSSYSYQSLFNCFSSFWVALLPDGSQLHIMQVLFKGHPSKTPSLTSPPIHSLIYSGLLSLQQLIMLSEANLFMHLLLIFLQPNLNSLRAGTLFALFMALASASGKVPGTQQVLKNHLLNGLIKICPPNVKFFNCKASTTIKKNAFPILANSKSFILGLLKNGGEQKMEYLQVLERADVTEKITEVNAVI